MERAVREHIDEDLLRFHAEQKTLKQSRGVRIGRIAKNTRRHRNNWRTLRRMHDFDWLFIQFRNFQTVVVAVGHHRAFADGDLLRRIGCRLLPNRTKGHALAVGVRYWRWSQLIDATPGG